MHAISLLSLSTPDLCTTDTMSGLPSSGECSVSKETTPERPLAQPPRLKSACESCHSSKVRCTGKQPCQRCAANGWDCVYKLASRIGKPKGSRNKSTLRRLQLEAEQSERERTRKPSTTSSSSSPLPLVPATGGSASSSIGIASPPGQPNPLPMGVGYPPWSWASDTDLWIASSENQLSARSALSLPDPSQLTSPDTLIALSSNVASSNAIERRRASGLSSYIPADETYDFPPYSPSLAAGTHSARASSPAYTAFSGDPLSGFDYGDGPWSAQACNCTRTLSWQLTRIDQLRSALTVNTTLRAFMYEANDAVYSVQSFLECHTCGKDSTSLSLMATMLTNVNHLFTLTLHQSVDPLATYMRNSAAGLPAEAERLASEAALIRSTVQRWLSTCEQALGVVQLLTSRAQSQQTLGGSTHGDQHERPDAIPIALWGLPDLESFTTMLWRVKESLLLYA